MTELVVALALIAGVVATHEFGFWLGSLTRSADESFDRQVGLVRTLTTALVAFLIGFAFSGAASRFIDRLDIIVKEANALGTAYLRADTIAEPQRGELRAALREYTADRVTMLSRDGRDQIEPLLAKVSGLHERMWRSAIKATQDNAPLMAVVLPPPFNCSFASAASPSIPLRKSTGFVATRILTPVAPPIMSLPSRLAAHPAATRGRRCARPEPPHRQSRW